MRDDVEPIAGWWIKSPMNLALHWSEDALTWEVIVRYRGKRLGVTQVRRLDDLGQTVLDYVALAGTAPMDSKAAVTESLVPREPQIVDRSKAEAEDQPMPRIVDDAPFVHDLVAQDVLTRGELGRRRYGTRLQPHNGRDALRDLYEELLDAACYVRQVQLERESEVDGA